MKEVKTKLLALGAIIFLTACGGEDDSVKSPSQVAAKVNNKEITVHQVNQILSKTRAVDGKSTQDVANEILDQLISQKILEEQALTLKLDRNPEVLSTLEAARQQILVDAYLKRTLLTPTVEDNAIQLYFKENPKFFNERKVFNYSQVVVIADEAVVPQLVEKVKSVTAIAEFVEFVKELNLQHKVDTGVSGTEKLPTSLIGPLYSIEAGDLGFLRMTDGFLVVQLHDVSNAPVEYNDAKPAINQFLRNQKRQESIEKLIDDFRTQATIEYVGEFSALSQEP